GRGRCGGGGPPRPVGRGGRRPGGGLRLRAPGVVGRSLPKEQRHRSNLGAPGGAGGPPLPRRGKLGCMSDAAAASVPPATAADAADPACDVAHGRAEAPADTRTLVAVFTSPVARFLLGYAR